MEDSRKVISSINESQILDSWRKNARPWIDAIRGEQIKSRIRVTNDAICDVIVRLNPTTALDLGCGEGWLTRYMISKGIDTVGIDGSKDLIKEAQRHSVGEFYHVQYDELTWRLTNRQFDLVVANFSLFGEQGVEDLICTVKENLTSSGSLVIQTLHPKTICGSLPYKDGWRDGSWSGFSSDFTNPAPWYFRTLESWVSLLLCCGMQPDKIIEPIDPVTGKAASIIFTAQQCDRN